MKAKRKHAKLGLFLAFVVVGSLSIAQSSFAFPTSDILSFENDTLLWTSSGNIGSNENASDGNQSLEITGCGWMGINSPQFDSSQIAAAEDAVFFDLYVPENQSSPWWIGDVGLLISIPSAGIYSQWFGQQLLNDLDRGVWVAAEVALPANIKAALEGSHTDVTLSLAVNTSSCAEPILIDNIRFAQVVSQNCFEDDDCSDEQYCYFSECGLETGVCESIPIMCPTLWEPICGCEGTTYANRCTAAMNGESVAHDGECETEPESCWYDENCDDKEYCYFPVCGLETGICNTIPDMCPTLWEPVCGCEGTTYPNRCAAAMNGESVAHDGEC